MLRFHPVPADPAYERLTRRDARRGLRLVCGIAAAATGVAVGFYLVLGSDPLSLAFLASIAVIYLVCWLLVARVPAGWLDTIAGVMGCTAIASTVGSLSTFPLVTATGTVGFITSTRRRGGSWASARSSWRGAPPSTPAGRRSTRTGGCSRPTSSRLPWCSPPASPPRG